MFKYYVLCIVQMFWQYWANIVQILFVWILSYNVQIVCKYCTNIVQILCKYCANIVQILRKYCTNIIQIFFESNRAIQEHKRLNRAKCYPLTHWPHWPTDPLTHFLKIQFIELHTQLKKKVRMFLMGQNG